MLMRSLIVVAVAGFAAIELPKALNSVRLAEEAEQTSDAPAPQDAVATPGSVNIPADAKGHFIASFRLNGKTVDGMVDTGASLVAINETTAKRLGISAVRRDYKYPVNTANGQTFAAHVVLDRVEIGTIRVTDVDAFIFKDDALSGTLIGLSFLRRLGSYTVEDGSLRLSR